MSLALTVALLPTFGCGDRTPKSYLYAGETTVVPPGVAQGPVGSVAQFRVEDDGTLTALNPSTIASVIPSFAAAVTSSNHLFVPGDSISEFGIGADGTLTAEAPPAATGTAITLTPNGQFALIANSRNATLSSYSLSPAGALRLINTMATGGYPEYVIVDGSGRFAYVTDSNSGTVLEYTISAAGILAANGSVATGGNDPRALVVSPEGHLFCANANSGFVTEFSINTSTGALTLLNDYLIWVQPQPGPLWISFDSTGTHAYAGNGAEIAQFTVDTTTGFLTENGITPVPHGALWGAVDPFGRFLFAAGVDGTVSQFVILNSGQLMANGSVSLGPQQAATLVFVQR